MVGGMKRLLSLNGAALFCEAALFAGPSAHAADLGQEPPPVGQFSPWDAEFGARAWFSSGKVGANNPLLNVVPGLPLLLTSRVLYKDETAISGELFGRVDHNSGLFVEGRISSRARVASKAVRPVGP